MWQVLRAWDRMALGKTINLATIIGRPTMRTDSYSSMPHCSIFGVITD